MNKIINYENLRQFAYSNDKAIKTDVKGILLKFKGLGGANMFNTDIGEALEFAEKGIIYVIPYYNPWSWMNRRTVKFVDEIVAVLCEHYGLNKATVKIASTGGSMGGLSALVYCAYAEITPSLCVATCPVCDLPYHFTERPDLPRTLYSAFGEYECTMDEALKSCSPLHLVEKLPDIPYVIFHCEEDKSVNIEKHSYRFVEEMRKSHNIDFITVPFRGHCDLSAEMLVKHNNAILDGLLI